LVRLCNSAVDSKLPNETLEAIAKEAAGNSAHDAVISKWSPIETDAGKTLGWDSLNNFTSYREDVGLSLGRLAFSLDRRSFFIREERPHVAPPNSSEIAKMSPEMMRTILEDMVAQARNRNYTEFTDTMFSSADLLYRMRCVFPTMAIHSSGPEGYKYVHVAGILHESTGFGLAVSEWKGGATFKVLWLGQNAGDLSPQQRLDSERFSSDVVELCNLMFTTDGEARFAYYHPSASALAPVEATGQLHDVWGIFNPCVH
jgi:hypothetical protein